VALRLIDHRETAEAERRIALPTGLHALTGLLGEHLPDWTWREPQAGASLWVRLPYGDATHFAQIALRYGVALLPGAVFSADGTTDDHTRLPYALPTATLTQGVTRLAQAWTDYKNRTTADVTFTSAVT
jgi:DNA-binding transcriptional MocR family regulator